MSAQAERFDYNLDCFTRQIQIVCLWVEAFEWNAVYGVTLSFITNADSRTRAMLSDGMKEAFFHAP